MSTKNIQELITLTIEKLNVLRAVKQIENYVSIDGEIHLRSTTNEDNKCNILIRIAEDDTVTIEGSYPNIHIIREAIGEYVRRQE